MVSHVISDVDSDVDSDVVTHVISDVDSDVVSHVVSHVVTHVISHVVSDVVSHVIRCRMVSYHVIHDGCCGVSICGLLAVYWFFKLIDFRVDTCNYFLRSLSASFAWLCLS